MCMRGGLLYYRTDTYGAVSPPVHFLYHWIAWSSSGIKILIWRSIDMLPVTW